MGINSEELKPGITVMQRMFLSAKIRDIRITALRPDYEGSILLDEEYMEKAGILPFEEVHVLNLNAGTRIITYAIKGKRGSGCVELNGPAARHGMVGDEVMVLTYLLLEPQEIAGHKPLIVCINQKH
jgi:aspartate 1-decarboxylase